MARLLYAAGYSLQANRKTREGKGHPDRNAQFEHISQQVQRVQKRGQPVVSIDTKKKELVGDSRILARNGDRRAIPSQRVSTISRTRIWARPFRMVFMT